MAGRPPATAANWRVPVFAVHSRSDQVVPIGPTEKRIDELKRAGVKAELIALERPTHFQTSAHTEGLRQAVPWLRQLFSVKVVLERSGVQRASTNERRAACSTSRAIPANSWPCSYGRWPRAGAGIAHQTLSTLWLAELLGRRARHDRDSAATSWGSLPPPSRISGLSPFITLMHDDGGQLPTE